MDTIGIVSDTHCGCRVALTPPTYWTKTTSDGVKWLWKCWKSFYKDCPSMDLLILNGDLIDGKQYRSQSTGILTASLGEQVEIAIECLAPLIERATKVIRIEGTPYHESFDGPLKTFDEHYNIKTPQSYNETIVRDIELDKHALLNVKHQPEGSSALYRGTTMDRELMWAKITEACKNIPKATHIIRSHLHSDAHMRGFGKEMNFTGCWSLQSPYAIHKRYYRWIPDIGGTFMQRDERGFKGWLTWPMNFPLPTFKGVTYEDL